MPDDDRVGGGGGNTPVFFLWSAGFALCCESPLVEGKKGAPRDRRRGEGCGTDGGFIFLCTWRFVFVCLPVSPLACDMSPCELQERGAARQKEGGGLRYRWGFHVSLAAPVALVAVGLYVP